MDYSTIIDPETRGFISRSQRFYPPDTIDLSIRDQRAIYDRMCQEFFTGYPAGISAQDHAIGGFRLRLYSDGSASAVTVLYLHGGGFVVGGLDSHDDVCAEICARTGLRVVSVDYRLCPEFRHPVQFQDCRDALAWVLQNYPGQVLLCGDSAGANLAAAVAHDARGRAGQGGQGGRIAGQVLVYGAYGATMDLPSFTTHANAPLLSSAEVAFYKSIRFDGKNGGREPVLDPTYAPLADTDFSNLPPSVLLSAECDPLADEGRVYGEKITAAGGKAVWFNETGLVHGYLRARTTVGRARDSFSRIINALDALAAGQWPY